MDTGEDQGRGAPGHAGEPAPAQAVGEENDRFALGFQRVDGLLHASAEFVRRIVKALFKIRHLGRVAHGSRQAFQLGAEDFAGDEVHIRFLSAGWRGCRGLGGRSRLAAGSMGEAGRLFAVFPGGGVSVSPPLHSFHTEGLLAGRPPPISQKSWEMEGRGQPFFRRGLLPSPDFSFYALAAAQISRAFSAAEEASGV